MSAFNNNITLSRINLPLHCHSTSCIWKLIFLLHTPLQRDQNNCKRHAKLSCRHCIAISRKCNSAQLGASLYFCIFDMHCRLPALCRFPYLPSPTSQTLNCCATPRMPWHCCISESKEVTKKKAPSKLYELCVALLTFYNSAHCSSASCSAVCRPRLISPVVPKQKHQNPFCMRKQLV